MDSINLVESFSEFKEFKNIDRERMMRILVDVFKAMLVKKYGSDKYFDIIINIDKGDLEIWHNRQIVEDDEVEDPASQIALSDAIKIEPDFEVGEEVSEAISISDFGRREILTIRQSLVSKIIEYEKDTVYQKYKDKLGEIITGEVYQVWREKMLVLDDEGIELVLPKSEQIPADFYRKGDTVRAVVLKVEMVKNVPHIILSRTAEIFLQRLIEAEVPEVYDGLITIRRIVREPGQRAKIAVESYDDRIDPVGACVGMKGSRIHGIVRELRNENIDVINYTTNPSLYINRSLSPAKVSSIHIDDATKKAEVYMKPDQVSLAIGKGGFNIKLAGKLTGYEIDVYRDIDFDSEDVDLDEFNDEIDELIIEVLKSVGFDTAKSVLELSPDEIKRRTEFDDETIADIIRILKAEFE